MTMTDEAPRLTRPGAGVEVIPRAVMTWRKVRRMKRPQVSAAIAALGRTDDSGRPVRLGVDAIGKIETGQRNMSIDTFGALLDVLGLEPANLMFGKDLPDLPEDEVARQKRLDHNKDLIAFARAYGLRYRGPASGRCYYGKPLEAAYAAYVALCLAERAEDENRVRTAREEFEAALALVPRDLAQAS